MKPQSLIMLVIAAACGLAAMVLTQRFLSAPSDKKNEDLVPILVAAVEMQGGTMLNESMLKTVDYPKAFVPAGAVTDAQKIVGRATRYHLGPSEVLTEAKLAPEGVKAGLETVIPEGRRAITVPMPTSRSVAGFIKPGSHVDVVLNMRSQGPDKPPLAKTILQDVKVLAVNAEMQNTGDPDNKGKMVEMVTFLLDPNEADKLALAQENGTISLRLRSGVDKEATIAKKITLDELISDRGGMDDEKKSDEPGAVFLDDAKQAKTGKKKGLGGLFATLLGGKKDKKGEEGAGKSEVAAPVPVPPTAPIPPVPQKVMKRLVYRDLEGKPLMEVVLDAESKMAANLQHLLEDVEAGKLAKDTQTAAAPAAPPATVEPVEEQKSEDKGG